MDGNVCNIQVLLRAAEFLERRERGKCLGTSLSPRGGRSWLVYYLNNKMHSKHARAVHGRQADTQFHAPARETAEVLVSGSFGTIFPV